MAKNNNGLIPIEDFNQGGLSSSKWSGLKNTLYRFIGFNPHSLPGILDVEQKLSDISTIVDSGEAVNERCISVPCSNGSVFWFSLESGKIWETPPTGNTRLVHTTTPALGAASCLGAKEFNKRIYWFTQKKVHYITVVNSNQDDWASDAQEDFAEFSVGDDEFHPSVEQNLYLFIGDGYKLAQIDDSNVFSANALDIPADLRIKSLGKIATDVLLGTYASQYVTTTRIIRWNTWGDSFTNSDEIPEVGINAFFPIDNAVLVQAGTKGNIYYYNGEVLELYLKIPGEYSPTKTITVHPYSVAQIEGQVLFAVSNLSGNPAPQLIYRIARHSRDYPYIIDQPYPVSLRDDGEFVMDRINFGGLAVSGSLLYVNYKRDTTVGLDKLDVNNKLSGAYMETRVMIVDRDSEANFAEALVNYAQMPANTGVDFYLDKNYAGYGDALQTEPDTNRNKIATKNEGTEFTTLQLKIKVTTSGNDAPYIESAGVKIR